jgi:preprotein translocase subunit SecG
MMTIASMPIWAAGPTWINNVLNVVLFLASLWLIILVLIQRGKGGGLAGAFGGAGGGSAFGSRAGDMFTKITIYSAAVWILLIMFLIKNTQILEPLPPKRGGGTQNSTPSGDLPE